MTHISIAQQVGLKMLISLLELSVQKKNLLFNNQKCSDAQVLTIKMKIATSIPFVIKYQTEYVKEITRRMVLGLIDN